MLRYFTCDRNAVNVRKVAFFSHAKQGLIIFRLPEKNNNVDSAPQLYACDASDKKSLWVALFLTSPAGHLFLKYHGDLFPGKVLSTTFIAIWHCLYWYMLNGA